MTEPKISPVVIAKIQQQLRQQVQQQVRPKAYLSGPMSGRENYNFPAFNEAAATLRNEGWDLFNPAETPLDSDWQWHHYMRVDIAEVAKAEAVFVLEGWQKSSGATKEVAVAHWLKIPIYDFETRNRIEPTVMIQVSGDESILAEADRLVGGDRQASYGHPIKDFTRTAFMFTGFLLDKLKPGKCITPSDIPCLMDLLKLSRCAEKYKRDNYVDLAGYAKTAVMVQEAREDRSHNMEDWLDILYPSKEKDSV